MPCYKCSNGKWKYGQLGNCQFDTLERCQSAEQAIYARERKKDEYETHEKTTKEETRKDVNMAKKPYDQEPMKPEKKPDKKKPGKM